ncbi:MAG: discoidin domain-containing protein [Alistipes sp.]|nr:discoidin domain-containing protein [Alistipes sp.]
MKLLHKTILSAIAIATLLVSGCCNNTKRSDYYTRGIGNYPGLPSEDFSPEATTCNTYRNIANMRAAYNSSSFDHNLTAQLATDGILSSEMPHYLVVTSNDGILSKREREWAIDGGKHSKNTLKGDNVFLNFALHGWTQRIDEVKLSCNLYYDKNEATKGYEILYQGSKDGENWLTLGRLAGKGLPGKESEQTLHSDANKQVARSIHNLRKIRETIALRNCDEYSFYRITLKMEGAKEWQLRATDLSNNGEPVILSASQFFDSAWMSAGNGEEWIYIDLGSRSEFDKVRLHWINKAIEGKIEVSDDAKSWKSVAALPGGEALVDEVSCKARGRYVRVLMQQSADGNNYILSEVEVMGRGGYVAQPAARPAIEGTTLSLSGGDWRLQRASLVKECGKAISKSDYDASSWVATTVPSTVLSSFRNIGAIPEPNFADNIFQISESYFNSDFWYRTEFEVPASFKKERVALNFDGINWKADIFLNGEKIGRIEGAFMRGEFDITERLCDGKNTLAVRIIKNEHFGSVKQKNRETTDLNGGILGADNPTFHASIGWDWISTIRGRNMGIYNEVYLTTTGGVTLKDPIVQTTLALPDTLATLTPKIIVRNTTDHDIEGVLKGYVGDIKFEQKVTLAAGAERLARFWPGHFTQLKNQPLQLWWPKGYGAPHLYDAGFSFEIDGVVSDAKEFKVGVRQMSHAYDGEALVLYVNGRRFIGRGGNWGFSENNLNYRGREYDIAVAHHANMNFTMMRNWVGQIGDEELYEACDRHGIMIWQDFWLANPSDGPDPYDNEMFVANAIDFVRRIRSHASIALYCGRNEGNPPKELDDELRKVVAAEHPDIHYISHSSSNGVSGHGPYRALSPREYFEWPKGNTTFHSERGMPNVVNYESLCRMLKEEHLWPQSDKWGEHDFTLKGAQRGATFNALVEKGFGKPESAKEFTELAQWINYNGYRAMFESRSMYRKGLLLWMTHPAWPSMVWQTYDYYFEPTAAYFGCMKANEPLHIQWNAATDEVEVVNYSAGDHAHLCVEAKIVNLDGSVVWSEKKCMSSIEDSTVKCFKLDFSGELTAAHFVKLTLWESERVVSDNFYIRGTEEGNFQAIRTLPEVSLRKRVKMECNNGEWSAVVTLRNTSDVPALMIRLNTLGAKDGKQILPVFYSDNYFSLLPGEERTVTVRWRDIDTRGNKAEVVVSGYNVKLK